MQRRSLIFGVLILIAMGIGLFGAVASNVTGSSFSAPMSVRSQGNLNNSSDLVVTSPDTVVNRYATLAVNAQAGSARILVTYPGGEYGLRADLLSAGDLIMIVQMAGASISTTNTADYGRISDIGGAGRYELVTISRADGGLITLNPPCGGLLNDYNVSGRVQIVKVPRYNTLTVNTGASLTAPPWNGSFGGILAVDVAGNAVINGDVNLTGRGFRGGLAPLTGQPIDRSEYVTNTPDYGAEKGEGIVGYQQAYDLLGGRYGRGAAANAGGGGTAHNAGGGGGANGDNGAGWTGQGVMDGTTIGAKAWEKDPGYVANGNRLTTSAGGGRGGYTYAFKNANAIDSGPGDTAWMGDNRRAVGGLGGRPLEQDPSRRLFMGGGGGGGHQNDLSGGVGGNAGGMIFLIAGSVSGAGQLVANGNPGENTRNQNRDGAGGGGAGGTIVVYANSLSGIKAQARGGKGGDQLAPIAPNPEESQGPGGGGGGGYVAFKGGVITVDVSGGIGGQTGSPSLDEFPANGATGGASGKVLNTISSIPYCSGVADIAVTNTNNAGSVVPGLTATYTVTVVNNGPGAMYGLDVVDALPPGFVPATKKWSCSVTPGSSCGSASGNGDLATKVNLTASGVATFTISALLDPAYTGIVSTVARAIIPPGGYDPVASNNESRDEDPATPLADLTVVMTSVSTLPTAGGSSTLVNTRFVPGTNVTFQLEVRNLGPSVATGFGVTNQLPPNISLISASCAPTEGSCGVNGSVGNLVQFSGMRLGVSGGNILRLTIVGFINPSAVGSMSNTASLVIPPVTPPVGGVGTAGSGFFDPNVLTNSSRVDGIFTPEANLSISKTNSQTSVVAGTPTTYQIDVINLGPSDANGFSISDSIPSMIAVTSSACVETGGSCGTNATVDNLVSYTNASLPAGTGRSLRIIVTGTVKGDASGVLSNTALVETPSGATHTDPDPTNNSSTDTDQVIQQADLAVSLSGPTGSIFAGNRVTYTLQIENRGPSKAIGAVVANALPASLEAATWVCQPTAGSACTTTSGTGGINTTVDLDLNARLTFVLTATVARNFGGSLVNNVSVATPSGINDPVIVNNAATVQISVIRSEGPTFFIGDGLSKMIMSQPFWVALDAANLRRRGAGNARLSNQTFSIPVESGAIDLFNGTGEINHSGGLLLWNGKKMVQIVSLRIDTMTEPAVVTGVVAYSDEYDKLNTGTVLGRLKLADLQMPSSVTYPMRPLAFNNLYYHQATMAMSDELATFLNFHFGGTNFSQGLSLGTISIQLVGTPERLRP